MSKTVAFAALTVAALLAAWPGSRGSAPFFADLWSQVFWLAVGTLATTFVLESILQRADAARRMRADAFAFRSFTANILNALDEIVGSAAGNDGLFEAALKGDRPFAVAAESAAQAVVRSTGFEPGAYQRYYLDVSGGLRDLSRNYVRLFSADEKEMLERLTPWRAPPATWCVQPPASSPCLRRRARPASGTTSDGRP